MRLNICILALLLFGGCQKNNSNELTGELLARKRIIQKIEVDGMGLLKDVKIESIEAINDSTYKGVHSFSNPVFDTEVRLTRTYSFTADLDSLRGMDELKYEIRTEGEWVGAGL